MSASQPSSSDNSALDELPPEHYYQPKVRHGWRYRAYRILFFHEEGWEKNFDLLLIVAILLSVLVTIADTVPSWHALFNRLFLTLEWCFTLLFTLEYLCRLLVVRRPFRYGMSFFGIIDLLSILPTYLSLLFSGAQYLLVIRIFRILRIFRVLKLIRYVDEAGSLMQALVGAKRKILIFVMFVMTIVVIFGALMYLIEGPEHGFHSIPEGMYWAIVTMATVGFGDISPETTVGRFLTSILILIGYAVIAVPTGIYTAELQKGKKNAALHCDRCGLDEHHDQARYCHRCGAKLSTELSAEQSTDA